MDVQTYYKRMIMLIRKDYAIMLKMLENVDPNNHELSEDTIPTLDAVSEIFISSIKENINGMLQFRALHEVLNKEELTFDEDSLQWEMDTATKKTIRKGKHNGEIYM